MKKFLLVLFFLISLVPQVFAASFSYDFDYEGGTDDELVNDANSWGTSATALGARYSNDYSASRAGDMEMYLQYIEGTEGHNETRASTPYFTYTVADGDVIYMRSSIYYPSGFDWGQVNSNSKVVKHLRLVVFNTSGNTMGMYSIMLNNDSGSSVRPFADLEPVQGLSGVDGSYFRYPPFVSGEAQFDQLGADTWHDIELTIQIADDADGFVSMTVNGNNQRIDNIQTIRSSGIGGSYKRMQLGSTWNGEVPATQKLYCDKTSINLNIPLDGVEGNPGNDITDPVWSSLSPTNGATGIDIDNTDIVGVVTDAGDGVNSATIKVHSDQITIDQSLLTISGTSTQYTVTYDNDYFTNDLTWDDNLTVSFGATDLNSNVAATVSTSFTVQSEPVVGTTFGSGAINTITNWDFKRDQAGQTSLPDRWEVFTLNGEDVLYINDSSFVSDGEGLGEYAVYQDFEAKEVELIFEARSAESIAGNSYADICGVIGWTSDRTYCYVMFNAATGTDSNGTHNYTQGEVDSQYTNLVNVKQDVWQKYKIVYQDETITVYRKYPNDEWVMTFTRGNIKLNKGKVGLGSYNDSVYFRNVSVKSLDDEVQLAQGVEYVGAKIT